MRNGSEAYEAICDYRQRRRRCRLYRGHPQRRPERGRHRGVRRAASRLLPAADFLLFRGKDRHRAHAVPRRRLLRTERLSGAVRQIGGPSGRGGKDGGAGRRHNPALRFALRRRRFLSLPAAAGGLGDGRKDIHLHDARRRTGAGGGGEGRFPRADCRRGADRSQMRRGAL